MSTDKIATYKFGATSLLAEEAHNQVIVQVRRYFGVYGGTLLQNSN